MRAPRAKADPGFARLIRLTPPPPSSYPELSLESAVTKAPSTPLDPGGVGGGTQGAGAAKEDPAVRGLPDNPPPPCGFGCSGL